MKEKLKSYSFWMSVTAAVILVINNLGKVFGFSFDNVAFASIVDSICGVLVVMGVLTMPKKPKQNDEEVSAKLDKNETDSADKLLDKVSENNMDTKIIDKDKM